MFGARTRFFALFAAVALSSASACTTDHDALAKKPNQGTGNGGSGGAAGFGGHLPVAGNGGDVSATGGHPDDEPPGASVLTFVQGIVDAPSVVVCLATVDAMGVITPIGKPLSKAPLAYGSNIVVHDITGADPATDVIQPFVIAGDLDLVAGLDCAAAIAKAQAEEGPLNPPPGTDGAAGAATTPDAGSAEAGTGGAPAVGAAGAANAGASNGDSGAGGEGGATPEIQPRLRARALPALPAGTLDAGRSLLMVANGCMGGAGFDAPDAARYCGASYAERTPTVSAVFAALSRVTAPNRMGVQALHASLATDTVAITSRSPPALAEGSVQVVSNLVTGELGPRPANIQNAAAAFGSTQGFLVDVDGRTDTLLSRTWKEVLALGGVRALADGSNYTLVLIGPEADLSGGAAYWNAPAVTIVPSDPQ